MTEIRAATAIAPAVTLVCVVLALDGAGLVHLGWGWALALACACSGLILIVTEPPSRALFVGALTRFAVTVRSLWTWNRGAA